MQLPISDMGYIFVSGWMCLRRSKISKFIFILVVMAASSDISGVFISLERLRALEALEAGLPAMLEGAKADRDKERFAALREKDKEHPEGAKDRYKRHYAANKDAINARRREKRQVEHTILAGKPPGDGPTGV